MSTQYTKKAIAMDPDDESYYAFLSCSLVSEGKYEKALEAISHCEKLINKGDSCIFNKNNAIL